MIDRLHTLIGNTANFATPKEAKELLKIADEGQRLLHNVRGNKRACNQYLGNKVTTDGRQKEFDRLLKDREGLFTAIAKNKKQFIVTVQKIKWREENKKKEWGKK